MLNRDFNQNLENHRINLKRGKIKTLQINVGKICNLACQHCHVEAGPNRTESMSKDVAERLIELIKNSNSIETVDFTGGAPELNPFFKKFILEARKYNKEIINRCNLTVLFEKNQEDLPLFFKENKVKIIASLPCYSKKNVEQQRGKGVFDKSLEALKLLNSLGYGKKETGLILDLVYNPIGAFLPPSQEKLEKDYRKELWDLFNIEFNNLYTITNMPIKRFYDDLKRNQKLESYYQLLIENFNKNAVSNLMCKSLISVSFDGKLFDCDFNQMLELPVPSKAKTIWDIESFDNDFEDNEIVTNNHCFACTAGAGSSCTGALNKERL